MYSFAKIIVIVMISLSNGYLFPSQFKYHNNPKSIIKNKSTPILNDRYMRKNNPNEYGNLVVYAHPFNNGVKQIVKRVRSPTMIIDEGLSPFRNTFDYIIWACIIISVFIHPPPPPPPMAPLRSVAPLLVVEEPLRSADNFVLGLLSAACVWSWFGLIMI